MDYLYDCPDYTPYDSLCFRFNWTAVQINWFTIAMSSYARFYVDIGGQCHSNYFRVKYFLSVQLDAYAIVSEVQRDKNR